MLLRYFLQDLEPILHKLIYELAKIKSRKKAWNRRFKPEKCSNNAGKPLAVHVWRPLLYQLSYTPKYVIAANEHLSLAGNIITQTRGFVKSFWQETREENVNRVWEACEYKSIDVQQSEFWGKSACQLRVDRILFFRLLRAIRTSFAWIWPMPDCAFDSENRMQRISFFLSAAIWLSVTKKLRITLLTMDLLRDIINNTEE